MDRWRDGRRTNFGMQLMHSFVPKKKACIIFAHKINHLCDVCVPTQC